MRKVFLLIALVATVFASNACGKKDDTQPQEQPKDSLEQKLIGKWRASLEIEVDAQGNKLAERESKCFSFEFFAGGKGNWLLDSDAICQDGNNWTKKTINWKVEGDNLIIYNVEGYNPLGHIKFEIALVEKDYFDLYVNTSNHIEGQYNERMDKVFERYKKIN